MQSYKSLALEWKDSAIHPYSTQKYSTTKRPLKRTQEQCLRHISEVPLHRNSALLYHSETAVGFQNCHDEWIQFFKNMAADRDHSWVEYTVAQILMQAQ